MSFKAINFLHQLPIQRLLRKRRAHAPLVIRGSTRHYFDCYAVRVSSTSLRRVRVFEQAPEPRSKFHISKKTFGNYFRVTEQAPVVSSASHCVARRHITNGKYSVHLPEFSWGTRYRTQISSSHWFCSAALKSTRQSSSRDCKRYIDWYYRHSCSQQMHVYYVLCNGVCNDGKVQC